MSRIAYVNGRYIPQTQAMVHIEDRGYQFADGIYEVIEIHDGCLVDEAGHLARLDRSLAALAISAPVGKAALAQLLRETVRRNRCVEGFIYLQITRGVARRDHFLPDPPVKPALVITVRQTDPKKAESKAEAGIKVVTTLDIRWKRPDIKSIALLPNVLAKAAAQAEGAYEAWLTTSEGLVTEGASSNAWIVARDGRIITHPATNAILEGITRTTLVRLIGEQGHRFEERPFTVEEAHEAVEAFATGATTLVTPVVAIDGRPVGSGRPGPVVKALRAGFRQVAERTATHRILTRV